MPRLGLTILALLAKSCDALVIPQSKLGARIVSHDPVSDDPVSDDPVSDDPVSDDPGSFDPDVCGAPAMLLGHGGQRTYLKFEEGDDDEVHCKDIENKNAQPYLILGPMHTGTNLLYDTMHKAWPSEMCLDGGKVWKHAATGMSAINDKVKEKSTEDELRNLIVLQTIRSPLALLNAWRENAYELEACAGRPVELWSSPCAAPMGPGYMGSDPAECASFENTAAVYNAYVQEYAELRQDNAFKAVITVPFEDLVLHPKQVLEKVAAHVDGLQVPPDVEVVTEAAQDWQQDRDAALQKLESKSYLEKFLPQEITLLCNELDYEGAAKLVAGSFVEGDQELSYMHDCENA